MILTLQHFDLPCSVQAGELFHAHQAPALTCLCPASCLFGVLVYHLVRRCGDNAWLLLQLAMKFLEKDELSNYTFQNDFMRPFVVVMRQSQVGWECTTWTLKSSDTFQRQEESSGDLFSARICQKSNLAKHGLQRPHPLLAVVRPAIISVRCAGLS